MMKKLLITSILILIAWGAAAQKYNNVRRMEYEIGVGINKAHKINGGAAKVGAQLFFETRMNIPETAFDFGIQASLGVFDRKADYAKYEHAVRNRGSLVFVADYNLRRWKRVALFGGLGIGMAFVDDTYSQRGESRAMEETIFDRSVVCNPRIGVELFSHVRITAEYRWMRKNYSTFGLNLGFVLGGGQRKE